MHFHGNYRRPLSLTVSLLFVLALSGCGLLFGSAGPEPTPVPPTSEPRALVPTFTATSAEPPTAAPVPPTETPTAAPVAAALTTSTTVTTTAALTTATTVSTTAALTTSTAVTSPTTTVAAQAKLTVNDQIVNVRSGPGTTYGLVGSAEANQSFEIIAKTEAGDWWQICCVNGQQGWVFGELARVENTDAVPVAANIAPPPVAAAPTATPAPAAPPAAAPTPTPAPQVAAPPPAADPCASIGGDGCKFKLREGPKFAPNGGTEIKLQMIFVHSGVDGGQPQGSYFVAMFKDGQKLEIGDGVRSIAQSSNQGTLGAYNYEYKIGLGSIPGNTVAGNYVIYVLDGEGARDSQDYSFTIPEGQGEVWIKWDQG